MLEQRIQQHFADSADLIYQAAQTLAKPIEAAVQAVLACVTNGGKVLACGNGGAAAAALGFAADFVGRFERERPELGAIALTGNGAVLTAGYEGAAHMVFARQVRALGQAGDVLLVLTIDGEAANLHEAVAAAHERDMTVLALSGNGGGKLAVMLHETDVHICIPHARIARIREMQLLALHCICDGVDAQLLGEQEIPL